MKISCQDASSHDGKIPMKEVKVPMVSIPYYENGVSKDKVALLIYWSEMFIKMHLWWERAQARKLYRKKIGPEERDTIF